MVAEFDDNEEFPSPVQDVSISSQLSLPDSFDESLRLDLYNEFKEPSCCKCKCNAQSNPKALAPVEHSDKPTNLKIKELLSINLDLKEKGHLQAKENKAKIEELVIENKQLRSLQTGSVVREKELQHEILEYKQKIHLIGIDLEHARRRAEKAENNYEDSISASKNSQQTQTNALQRLTAELEEVKSHSLQEIARIREETNIKVTSSRAHESEAIIRESKSRDQAIEQTKLLQQELSELRIEKETKEAVTLDMNKELERQLAGLRSDLKVKSCEHNTIKACQDRINAEANHWKRENDKNKDALTKLRQECVKLEQKSEHLEEAIRRKDEELKLFQHADLLVDDHGTSGASIFPAERRTLVKNSVALARKCQELQSQLTKRDNELAIERRKNEAQKTKEESNNRLFQELTAKKNRKASAYIVSALSSRDREISRLEQKLEHMRNNLEDAVQERGRLSSELSDVLERREQLDEMKGLVSCVSHLDEDDEPDDGWEDLIDHIQHKSKTDTSQVINSSDT